MTPEGGYEQHWGELGINNEKTLREHIKEIFENGYHSMADAGWLKGILT